MNTPPVRQSLSQRLGRFLAFDSHSPMALQCVTAVMVLANLMLMMVNHGASRSARHFLLFCACLAFPYLLCKPWVRSRALWGFVGVAGVYTLSFVGSSYVHDGLSSHTEEFRDALFLCLMPVLMAWMGYCGPSEQAWRRFLALAAVMSSLYAFAVTGLHIGPVTPDPLGHLRIGGDIHLPTIYGGVQMGLFFLCVAHAAFSPVRPTERLLLGVGALLSLVTVGLSGSRGPLVFLPLMAVLMVLQWRATPHAMRDLRHAFERPAARAALLAGAGLMLGLAVYMVPRFVLGVEELLSHNPARPEDALTSVGARLTMWTLSLHMAAQNPLWGVGPDFFHLALAELATQAGLTEFAKLGYDHAHNDFLHALASRGVVGLAGILLLYGVPLVYFWKASRGESPANRAAGFAGVGLVLLFVTLSMTDCFLYNKPANSWWVFNLACLFGMIERSAIKPADSV